MDVQERHLVLNTLIIIALTSIVVIACKFYDYNRAAEHYYYEFEPIKFYILKFCYLIITISFAFNARFLMNRMVSHATYGIRKQIAQKFKH